MVADEASLTNAFLQILTIAFTHYCVTQWRAHNPRVARIFDGTPMILLQNQTWRAETMLHQGIQDTDVMATARDQGSPGRGVNAYLWRGALDTLAFMPLASADPFGGVIITDWYQPPSASGERFKATAYILGRQLRADGVRVAIFRQVQQGGHWVDAAGSQATTGESETKVLARARELRAQTASQ